VYLSIPEYGFTSKLLSAKKHRQFVPTTPAKKNKGYASHEIYSPFANILHFSDELLQIDPVDNNNQYKESQFLRKMKITSE